MSCEQTFHHQIALEVGDDLPNEDRAAFEKHLRSCRACRELRDDLQRSQSATKRLARDDVEAARFTRIRARVFDRIGHRDRAAGPYRFAFRPIAIIASLIVALGVAAISGVWSTLREPATAKAAIGPPAIDPVVDSADGPNRQDGGAPSGTPRSILTETSSEPVELPPSIEAPVQTAEAATLDPAPGNGIETVIHDPPTPTESLIVRLSSENGDVVIYWQIDA